MPYLRRLVLVLCSSACLWVGLAWGDENTAKLVEDTVGSEKNKYGVVVAFSDEEGQLYCKVEPYDNGGKWVRVNDHCLLLEAGFRSLRCTVVGNDRKSMSPMNLCRGGRRSQYSIEVPYSSEEACKRDGGTIVYEWNTHSEISNRFWEGAVAGGMITEIRWDKESLDMKTAKVYGNIDNFVNTLRETTSTTPVENNVILPDKIKNTWKKVTLLVRDKTENTSKEYIVKIGDVLNIPRSDLKVSVVVFLPDFKSEPTAITSASNEPNNPAAKIIIYKMDKQIFKGWFYAKFPTNTPFEHERYEITLVNGIAQSSEKNRNKNNKTKK